MKHRPDASEFRGKFCALFFYSVVGIAALSLAAERGYAQGGYERSFPVSKATVEKILRDMPFALAGRLPVLEGFAAPGDRPLDSYQRGYFQTTVQVTATAGGGSVVRVSAKVTAWYADPIATRSGYRLLPSNGRIEADLLDELAGELEKRAGNRGGNGRVEEAGAAAEPASGSNVPLTTSSTTAAANTPVVQPRAVPPQTAQAQPPQVLQTQPTRIQNNPSPDNRIQNEGQPADESPAAPMPRLPETGTLSASLAEGISKQPPGGAEAQPARENPELKAEAESLEEVLKNQSHPKNLVAVKKSGTPVVDSPSLKAKTLFLASEHDEFEMLDFTADWVHVRISGLSRGWVWRNALEMPSDIPDISPSVSAAPAAGDLFRVTREEKSIFPGDWGPLQGKNVRIFSVEMIDEKTTKSTSQAKLEFAKSVLEQRYADIANNPGTLGGVVLMFDSADGGMLAVTLPVLQQWKAGTLSDAGLWHQSFFDPPETFGGSAGTSASQ